MECPRCNYSNEENKKICVLCGASLTATPPHQSNTTNQQQTQKNQITSTISETPALFVPPKRKMNPKNEAWDDTTLPSGDNLPKTRVSLKAQTPNQQNLSQVTKNNENSPFHLSQKNKLDNDTTSGIISPMTQPSSQFEASSHDNIDEITVARHIKKQTSRTVLDTESIAHIPEKTKQTSRTVLDTESIAHIPEKTKQTSQTVLDTESIAHIPEKTKQTSQTVLDTESIAHIPEKTKTAHSPNEKQTIPDGHPSPIYTDSEKLSSPQLAQTKESPQQDFSETPSRAKTEPMKHQYSPSELTQQQDNIISNNQVISNDITSQEHLPAQQHSLADTVASQQNLPAQQISLPRPDLKGFSFALRATLPPLWKRLLSGAVDLISVTFVAFLFSLVFTSKQQKVFPSNLHGFDLLATFLHRYSQQIFVFFIVFSVVYFVYSTLLHGLFERTLGKWLMSLKVIDRSGQRMGWLGSIARSLAFLLFFFLALIGLSWILMDKEFRGLHDRVAGSLVINSK